MADADARLLEQQQQADIINNQQREILKQQARGPIEQLRDKYAQQDALAQSTQGVPGFEQPEVAPPFIDQNAMRQQEMIDAGAAQMDADSAMAALAAEKAAEFDAAQQLGTAAGIEKAQNAFAQAQADQQAELDSAAAASLKEQDDKAALTVSEVFRQGNLGQKIATALSILIGGYSQGLTGAAENPVLKFLEGVDKQIMEQRGLQAKERAAVREHVLGLLEQKTKAARAKVEDAVSRAQMDKLLAETDKIRSEISDARKMTEMNRLGAKVINPLELPMEQRETLVRLPDGSYVQAPAGKLAATELRTYMKETGPVINDLKDLVNFTKDKRFYNPVGEDRARVQTKIATLVGALRLPITGPGPLTDTEREFLMETIGDPSKFFSLKANQMAKLNEIQNNINRRVKNAYFQAGIDLDTTGPKTQTERLKEERGISDDRRAQIEQYLRMKKASQQSK